MDIKVIVADCNVIIREGLKALLIDNPQIKVISEAFDSDGLRSSTLLKSASILIIDFTEPGFKPEDITKAKILNPELRVLAITNSISKADILRAIQAGISGYLLKDCDKQEILEAVESINDGKNFFCGKILDALLQEPHHPNQADLQTIAGCCEPVDISNREMEIIRLIAEGLTNKEIADKLFLSTHTVNTHRKNIMQKLGIGNTAGLVMYALKEGIVTPEVEH